VRVSDHMGLSSERQSLQGMTGYGVAIAVVIVALLIRFAINPLLGPTVPYLQFFPAILVASWYGGFRPGVLAVLLSATAAYIWFLLPVGLLKIPALVDLFSLTLFGLVGIGISFLSGAMKAAEAAQGHSADQWRTTLASIGDGVIVTDMQGRVTFLNEVAERLTGWDLASARQRPLDDIFVIVNEHTREAVPSPVTRVLREGVTVGLANHTMLKGRDGTWTPIADSGAPIRGTRGELDGVVLVFRDVRVEREASSALKRSENLLNTFVENSSAVIYAKDLAGRYLLVNRRFGELFHVSTEAAVGKTDYDLFAKTDADVFREMDKRVAIGGVALTEEEHVPLDDGIHTYISVKCPLWDDHGQVYAVFGISTDITDRRRSEAAARAYDERMRIIIETALDAVITMDTAGHITGWSPQAESTFGWSRTEAIGRSLAETIIPERFRESHRRGLERFLATGEGPVLGQRLELFALHRHGRELPIELAITAVHAGDSVSFSAFVRDITERKRMDLALTESRRHYQALAESLPNLVWTCRPDGYCDFLSRQWVDYTGRPQTEQLGSGWVESVHPDDRERVQQEWQKATTSNSDLYDVEFRIQRADGVYRWFKTRGVPLRDASGVIVKWFGSNTDFEDYKQSEGRLRAQLERLGLLDRLTRAIGERQDLSSILQVVVGNLEDHMPLDFCCVCLYDRTEQSLTVGRLGPKSTALALELEMSEKARIAIDENGLSRCVRGQLVYEPDAASNDFPFPQRLARGGLRSFVAAPLLVESHVFGVLVAARRDSSAFSSAECEFVRQLSEHVALAAHQAQLYSALQQAYDDLRQTQQAVMQQERLKALGQMASGIAHDINNAISPVALYTESLLDTEPNLSPRARDYLLTIQRANEDVSQTVARMREFYRLREPQLTLAPLAINSLIHEVVTLTRARWFDIPQQRGIMIELVTELTPDAVAILGVESEIREALINLIFNAVDAMSAGGRITIRTRVTDVPYSSRQDAPPRRLHIEVSDTGVGMDVDTRRRCFEPFFTTKGERGTGLGLAMVYGMVQRHGAEIDVDSTPGQGTTMRVTFDVPELTAEGTAAPPRKDTRPSRMRILLVDDDPLLLKSLRDALEGDGHSVTAASGGQAGIDAFVATHNDGRRFDVVITDLGMPYVDGRQVASAIKGTSATTPIIMLTGWGQRLTDDAEIPPHVDRVLNKPPKLSELRPALAELQRRERSPRPN
jgi:PAS domain S-box-containing protein